MDLCYKRKKYFLQASFWTITECLLRRHLWFLWYLFERHLPIWFVEQSFSIIFHVVLHVWILLPWYLYFTVEPPESPDKDRQVRNLSSSVIAIEDGHRFTVKLTWIPPLYPYKTVKEYFIIGHGSTNVSALSVVIARAALIKGAKEPR